MIQTETKSAIRVYLTNLWSKYGKISVLFVVSVLLLSLTGVFSYTRGGASAAPATYLNFQGRLLGSGGNLVADGTYNIEFNLYNVASGGSTEWTETYLNTGTPVTVKNGFFSVNLGSLTAFPGTINWDQQQWLGMTVRGTGSCAFGSCTPADSEMTPRFSLTAVPRALSAANVNSGATSTASTNSNAVTIQSGDATGTTSDSGNIVLDAGTATGTTGALLFGTTNASALTLGHAGITSTLQGSISLTGAGTALSVTNDATIGGTLGVTGTSTFTGTLTANGGLTVAAGHQFTNASSTLNTAQAVSDVAGGGDIGTAAATVDVATTFNVSQTTASQTLTLPTPTSATAGRIVYVNNVGSASFTMYGSVIGTNKSNAFIWNGTAWVTTVSLSGSVVNTIGTIDSQTKSADGAVIAVNAIYLQTADATYPGLVSATTQTLAGDKTFTGLITGSAGLSVTGATTDLNVSSNFDTNINTGTSTGAIALGNSLAGAITLQSASTISLTGTSSITGLTSGSATALTVNNSTSTGNVFVAQDNGTAVFTVADGGSVLGKNTTDSATAFRIQNVAGNNALTVDTSNLAVTVGATGIPGSNFAAKVDYTAGTTPRDVMNADFNRDGYQDMAVANNGSTGANGLSIFMNNGDGTFAAKVDYTTGSGPYGVAVADYNGDGYPDIAVTNNVSNTVSVFINSGTGTFAAKVDYTTGTAPRGITTADVSGDGKPDLLVASTGSANMSVFINSGTGTFAAKVDYTTGSTAQYLAAADFNGDGKIDVAVTNQGANTVSVFMNNGTGTFAAKVDYTTASGAYAITAGDFNNDGKSDIAITEQGAGLMSILINSGTGTFAAKVDYTSGTVPLFIKSGDFNNDGKADLVTANSSATSASVFYGLGNGTFSAKNDYTVGTNPRGAAVADFNNDGKQDIAISNNGSTSVSVLINTLTTGAGAGLTVYAPQNTAGQVIRLSSNATNDALQVKSYDGTTTLSRVDGGGSLLLGDIKMSFAAKTDYTTGSGSAAPYNSIAGDFNNDGKQDVAVVNNGSTGANGMSVFLGTGAGILGTKTDYTTGSAPRSVSTADFNGDGILDLAVVNGSSTTVSIFIGVGDGTFNAKVDYATAGSPRYVATADFNKDGKIDLAVANGTGNSVSILLGVGDGTFNAKVDYTTATTPLSVVVTDVNSDGKLDLVTGNFGTAATSMSVLTGNGDGTFNAKVDYAGVTSAGTWSVAAGDLNGDGKVDLVLGNRSSFSSVSVFLNSGTGTFPSRTDYGALTGVMTIALADFNGDGRLDVAAINDTSDNVSILPGNGDGTLSTKIDYATGAGGYGVTVSDMNNDYKPDIIVANETGNSISVILNNNLSHTSGSLQLTGQLIQRTTTNTTTAVQIQNASGINVLGIDTVNGAITTDLTTLSLFNTNATTINFGGAATSLTIGATTGTLTVRNANQTFGNAAGSGLFTNNGATVNTTLAVADDSDGGALGGTPGSPLSAAASVDVYTSISINQTTAGQSITLPTPTASTTYGRVLYISNVGTASFTIGAVTINPGASVTFMWSNSNGGASWQLVASGGTGSGVTTVGAVSGTPTANGATITGSTLNLAVADDTNAGLLSIAAQNIGGAKTFTSLLTGSAGATISGGAVSLTGNAASQFSTTSGNLTLDSAAILNLGTTNTTSVVIGNTANNTSVLLQGTAAATYTIGTSNNTGGIVLGNSTATNTISIGSAAGNTSTQTINIGTSATAGSTSNITLGSTIAGTVALQGPATVTNRTTGSADSFVVSNSTSTGNIAVFKDNATAVLTIADGGNTTATGQLTLSGTGANQAQLVIKQNASQSITNPLVVFQTSGGTELARINAFGTGNIGFGNNILNALTSGTYNVALGSNALDSATTGGNNIAIGRDALTANDSNFSVAIGTSALAANVQGENTAVGYNALSTGVNNLQSTAVGAYALESATGNYNTAVGRGALQYSSGQENVGIGTGAGRGVNATSTFSFSTIIGSDAGLALTTGANNTFIGRQAGTAVTTQANNVLIGYNAGNNLTTGTGNNIIIGAGLQASSATVANELRIGGVLQGNTSTLAAQFNGALTVVGNTTLGSAAGVGQFTNNGATLNTTLAVANDSDGGSLGGTPGTPLTAAASVDVYTSFNVNQTTASQTITLPTPTSTTAGRIVYVSNVGSASFTMYSILISAGGSQAYIWNGTAWTAGTSAPSLTLQNVYDNSTTPATILTSSATKGVLIKAGVGFDQTALFQVQKDGASPLLTVDSVNSTTILRAGTDTGVNTTISPSTNFGTSWTSTGSTWTKGATSATHAAGTADTIQPTSALTTSAGKYYQVSYTVSGYSAGSINFAIGSTTANTAASANGTYTQTVLAGGAGNLIFTPTASFVGTIDSVAVIQIVPANAAFKIQNTSGASSLEVRASSNSTNLFVGNNAGAANTVSLGATNNTAFGSNSLQNNVSGNSNTAIGANALQLNSSGTENFAGGVNALLNNTTGQYNIALGNGALQTNTITNSNVVIGYNALSSLSGASSGGNTAVGTNALVSANGTSGANAAFGNGALSNLTTGSYNTSLGNASGGGITTGQQNVFIGDQAGSTDFTFATTNVSNSIAIGQWAQVQQSNSIVLGVGNSTSLKFGIGNSVPLNYLSAGSYRTGDSAGTICQGSAGCTVANNTITGIGTNFVADMVGNQILFADGTSDIITAVGSTTSITVSGSRAHASSNYRIYYQGLQVVNDGTAYIQGNSANQLVVKTGAGTNVLQVNASSSTVTAANLAVTTNTTLGSAAGVGQFTNNGSTVLTTKAVADDSDGGALGGTPASPLTAAQSVDVYSSFSIAQTTTGQTITLPTPTANTTYGRRIQVSNIGTASFIINGSSIVPGATADFVWSNTNGGASWQYAGDGGGSGNYIQNQNSADQVANFRIGGNGVISPTANSAVGLTVNGTTGTAATALAVSQTGTATAATIVQSQNNDALAITANALTTANGLSIGSTGTGLTSGSLLKVTSATTGAVATNGIVSLNATGNYTSTSNAGLLNVAANATTAGTIVNIQGTSLTTGTALNVNAGGSAVAVNASGRLVVSGTANDVSLGSVASISGTLSSTTNTQGALVVTGTASPGGASTQGYTALIANATTASGNISGSGTVSGFNGIASFTGGGTLAALYGGGVQISNTSTGTISSATGFFIGNAVNPSGTISRDVGINILNQTAGSANANLLIGSASATSGLSGNWSIYSDSAYQSALAGNLRVGGTTAPSVALDVTGSGAFTGNLTVGSGAGVGLFTNNGATLNTTLAKTDFATGGSIGSAATTVDIYTSISVAQTTAGQTLTIPTPTSNPTTVFGRVLYLSNVGTTSFIFNGVTVSAGSTATLIWSNTDGAATGGESWQFAGADGNGILNQNTSAQTANFWISGTGRADTSFSSPLFTTPSSGTSTAITVRPGDSTTNSGTGSTLTLQGSNQTGTTSTGGNIAIDGGTGTTTNGSVLIGGTNAGAITIGKSTSTSTITLGNSTVGQSIFIGHSAVATGNTQNINIGDSALGTGKNIVVLGSTNDASQTTIRGGSGGLSLGATAGNIALTTTTSGNIAVTSAGTFAITSTNLTVSTAGRFTLAGGQAPDLTTTAAATSTAITIRPGDSTTASGTGSALVLQGSNQTGTTSIGGKVQIDGGTGTTTNGAIELNVSNDGAITLGKSTGTSTITVGQSTVGQTINIGGAQIATGNTQTIHIGDSATGTGKDVITIGNANGASSLNLQAGSGNAVLNATAGNLTLSTTTSGTLAVTSAGALNLTGAAASTINYGTNTLAITSGSLTLSAAGRLTVVGGQAPDITTVTAGTSAAITIRPGDSSTASGTGSALILQGSNQTGTTSTGGAVNIDGGTGTSTTGIINIATANTANKVVNIGSIGSTVQQSTIHIADSNGNATQAVTIGNTGSANNVVNIAGGVTGGVSIQVGSTGAISIGSAAASTVNVGTGAFAHTVNVANDATTAQTVSVGSTFAGSTLALAANGAISLNATGATFSAGARTLGVTTSAASTAGGALTVSAGTGGSGTGSVGGLLTLQGGTAGGTNADGGGVTITGGAGAGTGTQGLVNLSTTVFSTAPIQTFSSSGVTATTAGYVDLYSTLPVTASVSGAIDTIGDPGQSVIGRIIYVTARSGSSDLTLRLNSTRTPIDISLKANSTATLIWNGTDWTAAGASSSTDLQAAYNNTLSSAGGAEIVLNNSASANGLTIRNNATTPITGALLEVQTSIGSNLFSVNNNAVEYATNGGAETQGTLTTNFPSSSPTWKTAPNGGTTATVTRDTTNLATGTAAVKVVTAGTTANQGADNELSVNGTATALTANLQYSVSFSVKGTANFSLLDVVYSKDGTNTGTTTCATGKTVTVSVWTRVQCTFTAPSSGITSSNAIFIRESDTTVRTFYIDNLSVNVLASVNHAIDGSVDAALGTNWVAVGGSVTRSTSVIYDTSGSVSVAVSGSANRGVYNNLAAGIIPTQSAAGVQYRAAFYLKADTGTVTLSNTSIYYSPDSNTTKKNCEDLNVTSITTAAGWTLVSCIFTTDNTSPTGARFYITNTATTDFYVDNLTINLNTNTANNVQVGGGNNGGPVTLFTLDRASSAPIAANNDSYLGSMYYDTTTGRIQCYEADGWGACGSAPDNIVNLTPEFPGAVLNGSGVGTMTADFCAASPISVNASICDGTGTPAVVAGNYYKWTSPQASTQTYSIYVSYQLPATFKAFSSDTTVQLTGRVDDTSNAAVTYQMYKSEGGTLTQCWDNSTSETPVTSSNNTWQTVGINGNESTSCGFTTSSAGDTVIFKINMKAANNHTAYVNNLSFTTTGR